MDEKLTRAITVYEDSLEDCDFRKLDRLGRNIVSSFEDEMEGKARRWSRCETVRVREQHDSDHMAKQSHIVLNRIRLSEGRGIV